ncbi:MAG TPA: phosphotransferase [Acidimicrobiia bacterium]|nr:phosphotransferase [Acidimicrobiia bacterium]
MELDQTRPELADEALPGFGELMNSPVPGPLVGLYDAAGSTIESVERIQVTWHPGTSVTVRFRVRGGGGDLHGRRDVVAVLGHRPEDAIHLESEDASVAMWVVPHDPYLPGLRSALHVPTVGLLLSDLGFRGEVVSCQLRAYRPGRRALVQVTGGSSSVFLKILRPSDVDALHKRHRALAAFVPVPDSLGLDRELGIVVMPALAGDDLRTILRNGSRPIPQAAEIARLVEGLPEPEHDWRVASPVDGVPRFVDLLGRLLPETKARLDSLADAISSVDTASLSPIHGDFHEAQVLVSSGRPVGLVDLDTFGWGHPTDDAATMLGHLHLLAPGCESPRRVIHLARELNRLWDGRHDPIELRLRVAATVLGLATGPFRIQSRDWPEETKARLAVAEQWVDSSQSLNERSLIPVSAASHEADRS